MGLMTVLSLSQETAQILLSVVSIGSTGEFGALAADGPVSRSYID